MSDVRTEIPKRIGRYEVVGPVGYGAMGAVYKAFDPLIKRTVAIKTIRVDVPSSSEEYQAFLERFATEARVTGKLSHPNIVTLYDIGNTDDHIPWLAMEYVDGETVAELMGGEKLPPEAVVGMVSQIASALDYAHSEDVIHRDIKPSNLIVFDGEKVKVTDFGIARLIGEQTTSGLTMGTPSYMSPEQAMGEDLDGRTDIFSLGVVAFEMLSGKQPFPGNNVTSILYKLVHVDPVQPEDLEVMGLLPDKWRDVFLRVLAKDPKERYDTAAAFVQDLELCLGSWFGAVEGETVILKAPPGIANRGASSDSDDDLDDVLAEGDTSKTMAPSSAGIDSTGSEPGSSSESPSESGSTSETMPPPGTSRTVRYSASEAETVIAQVDPALPVGASSDKKPNGDTEAPTQHIDRTVIAGSASGVGVDKTVVAASPIPPPEGEEGVFGDPDEPGEASLYVDGDETALVSTPATQRSGRKSLDLSKPLWLAAAILFGIAVLLIGLLVRRPSENPPGASSVSDQPAFTGPVVIETGGVEIVSSPEGAKVHLNDVEQGVTPVHVDDLQLGAYEVRFELEGYETENVLTELTVESPRSNVDVTLKRIAAPAPKTRAAYLKINSVPSGAQVQIDGRTIGNTPIQRYQVRSGARLVRLTAEGFIPWEDTVRARGGATEALVAEMSPMMAIEPEVEVPEPVEAPEPEVVEGSLVKRGDPGVIAPECVECSVIGYPQVAKDRGLEGVVELSFVINEFGRVENIQIEQSGGSVFDEAVTNGVRAWRYEPATKKGVRVKMAWRQRFRFQRGR